MIAIDKQSEYERILRHLNKNFHVYMADGRGEKASRLVLKLKLRCTPRWQNNYNRFLTGQPHNA